MACERGLGCRGVEREERGRARENGLAIMDWLIIYVRYSGDS